MLVRMAGPRGNRRYASHTYVRVLRAAESEGRIYVDYYGRERVFRWSPVNGWGFDDTRDLLVAGKRARAFLDQSLRVTRAPLPRAYKSTRRR